MRNSVDMGLSSLIPRPVQIIGEKGLVSTVVHVLNFPTFWEFWIYYVLRSIVMPGSCIFNRTLAISVQDLDSAMLYAFVRH